MRIIAFVTIILLSCGTNKPSIILEKPIPIDSLRKYSYEILGFKVLSDERTIPSGGTGFFIRKNGRLFLITAKHVFSDCNENLQKANQLPDIMSVFLEDTTGFPTKVIQVNIKTIKDTTNCLPVNEDIDVIAVEIQDNTNPRVNSVEEFLLPPFKETGDLVMFGFPGKAIFKENNQMIYASASKMLFPQGHYGFFQFVDSITRKVDTINSTIISNDVPLHDSLKGYSGSPLFLQDLQTLKWRVCGLFAASSLDTVTKTKAILAPLPKYIMQSIDSILITHP